MSDEPKSYLTLRALVVALYRYHADRDPDESEVDEMMDGFIHQYGRKFTSRADAQMFELEMVQGELAYDVLIKEEAQDMVDGRVVYEDEDDSERKVVAEYEIHIFNDHIYQQV